MQDIGDPERCRKCGKMKFVKGITFIRRSDFCECDEKPQIDFDKWKSRPQLRCN